MKVAICGLAKAELGRYIKTHYSHWDIVQQKPELVLCYGGDGTLLFAERQYPGVTKVMIRNSRVCYHCAELTRQTILKLIDQKKYRLVKHYLVEGKAKGKTLYGINDVVIGHKNINTGLRFTVYLNGEHYGREFLGDGIVVSTPLGSTGYYQSITRSTFQDGLGVAFNNAVNNIGHIVVDEKTRVTVRIHRESALLMADNNPLIISLEPKDEITIQLSRRFTTIAYFPGKQCKPFNICINEERLPLGYCQVCAKLFTE